MKVRFTVESVQGFYADGEYYARTVQDAMNRLVPMMERMPYEEAEYFWSEDQIAEGVRDYEWTKISIEVVR